MVNVCTTEQAIKQIKHFVRWQFILKARTNKIVPISNANKQNRKKIILEMSSIERCMHVSEYNKVD